MINGQNIYSDDGNKPLKIIAIVLLSAVMIYFVYKTWFFANAEYRYTVAVIIGEYHDSKNVGVTFSYKVEGKTIQSDCIDYSCHNLEKGKRYIVRYYVDRPSWNSLLTEYPVSDCISVAPADGWAGIPQCK